MKILIQFSLLTSSILFYNSSKNRKPLEIYLMSSFVNDSIMLNTETNNFEILPKFSTNECFGLAASIFFNMSDKESTKIIKDLKRGVTSSIKYSREYTYLYIYYHDKNFIFNYTKKILVLQ